jgi:hypothetical protein
MGKPNILKIYYSACRELTPGTETSKYREDKKSIEIPPVVASEKGRAQTKGFILWGCRTAFRALHQAKYFWKVEP